MEFIDWQPGNGSRYPLAFVDKTEDGQRTWLIAYLRDADVGGPSFKWKGDHINVGYMAGKMGIRNSYDAQAIATFLLTRGIKADIDWDEEWGSFTQAEKLGFDKLISDS